MYVISFCAQFTDDLSLLQFPAGEADILAQPKKIHGFSSSMPDVDPEGYYHIITDNETWSHITQNTICRRGPNSY